MVAQICVFHVCTMVQCHITLQLCTVLTPTIQPVLVPNSGAVNVAVSFQRSQDDVQKTCN